MTTTRERKERKAERLREWAAKREAEAHATLERDNRLYRGDHAFNTQPGHIPERARVNARTDRAVGSLNKAAGMTSRAAGITSQLDRSIYSDDPDAIEQLQEKLAKLEAKRDALKAANAAYRKAHRAELKAMTKYERDQVVPAPAYAISNLGGVITNTRKRIALLSRPHRPRSITARRDGDCSECTSRISAGDTITEISPRTWAHAECAEGDTR